MADASKIILTEGDAPATPASGQAAFYVKSDGVFYTKNDAGAEKTVGIDLANIAITGGSISGTDITVGAGKTLDVSAGTLTLADNQISGDKIHGGTISAFASTGIDDNADAVAITIDSSERVGIGTASPVAKLDVVSNASTTSVRVYNTATGTVYSNFRAQDGNGIVASFGTQSGTVGMVGTTSDHALHLFTNNTAKIAVSTAGNVGIGTTAPVNKLDVEGAVAIGAAYSETSTAPTNGLIVEGNVGIGTASPSTKLEVAGAITAEQIIISNASGSNTITRTATGATPVLSVGGDTVETGGDDRTIMKIASKDNLDARDILQITGNAGSVASVFTSSGKVGIGTASPVNKLDVEGAVAIGASYSGTSTAPTNGLIVEGNVGIGTASPAGKLHVYGANGIRVDAANADQVGFSWYKAGTQKWSLFAEATTNELKLWNPATLLYPIIFYANNNTALTTLTGTGNRAVYSDANGVLTNSSSDQSLKTNVATIPYGLSQALALNPIKFNWTPEANLGGQSEIGFIAQEVQAIIPEVVGTNSNGLLSLDYPKLTVVLCKAIQELNQKLENYINGKL